MQYNNKIPEQLTRKNYNSLINLENSHKDSLIISGVSPEGPRGFDQNFINLNDLSNLTLKKNFVPLNLLKHKMMMAQDYQATNHSIPGFFTELMIDSNQDQKKRDIIDHKKSNKNVIPNKDVRISSSPSPPSILKRSRSSNFHIKDSPTTSKTFKEDSNLHKNKEARFDQNEKYYVTPNPPNPRDNRDRKIRSSRAYRIKYDDSIDSSMGNRNETSRQFSGVRMVNASKATKNNQVISTPTDSMKTRSFKLGFADNNLLNEIEDDSRYVPPPLMTIVDYRNQPSVSQQKERA